MRPALISAFGLILCLAQPPAAGWAAASSAPMAVPEAGAATSEEVQDGHKLDLVRAAPVTLRQALGIAEQRHPGTKSLRIETDLAAEGLIYRVRAARDGQVWESVVSADSGMIVSDHPSPPRKDADGDERAEMATLDAVGPGMSEAVAVAERSARGRAVLGELQIERGRLKFVIVVLAGDDFKEVVLEPPGARLRRPAPLRPGSSDQPNASGAKQPS